jgi:hypothetical protein
MIILKSFQFFIAETRSLFRVSRLSLFPSPPINRKKKLQRPENASRALDKSTDDTHHGADSWLCDKPGLWFWESQAALGNFWGNLAAYRSEPPMTSRTALISSDNNKSFGETKTFPHSKPPPSA